MCGGVHYGEVEGLVSVERWSCSRGASCVVEYTMERLRDWSPCYEKATYYPFPSPLPPGLSGVSPSPSNCSSVDNSTNTCGVTAAAGSSLTLCVDFTRYPSDAPRFADITTTVWRRNDAKEWFLYCESDNCRPNPNSHSVNISFSSLGMCAHVESVQQDIMLLFVFYGDPHPVGEHLELHRRAGLFDNVTFSIQG